VTLPHRDRARVDQSKIQDYLLAFDHAEGGSKAAFFSQFGFTAQDWEALAAALISHGQLHPVVETSGQRIRRQILRRWAIAVSRRLARPLSDQSGSLTRKQILRDLITAFPL
jgi:hypothetical protein